ncbi:MAG: sugar phosphate nucleotidyltransferase [Eubacteriales bacterium]|jgi:UTP-glucose-1-phosphate uridylyltransferase|nr:sugar phosphate nucleotidyltransferase [Eubacteriales bacterium]
MATDKTTLVIMAAGMGSRFGGLKQIEPVGPNGETILDFSIYDAVKAGFDKVVFIIKKDFENEFKQTVGKRAESKIKVEYAFQDINDLPKGYKTPEGRVKPWGTAHAILSCKSIIDTPFAVINADDYYGQNSFKILNDHLKATSGYNFSMVGYKLKNTLTENGTVSRGVCEIENNTLKSIVERTKIKDLKYTEDGENWIPLPQDTVVSMNMWGFTPVIFEEIEKGFIDFLNTTNDLIKSEYYIPLIVDSLIKSGKAKVDVLQTDDKWYGITYKEDKPMVVKAIKELIERGLYDGM